MRLIVARRLKQPVISSLAAILHGGFFYLVNDKNETNVKIAHKEAS